MKPYARYSSFEAQMHTIKAFFSQYFRTTMSSRGLNDACDFSLMELKALSAFTDVNETYTVSQLSSNAYMPLSNMTSILSRLERKNIVTKSRKDPDQRIVRVSLTAQGKKIFYSFMKKRVTEIEQMIGRLNSNEQEELFDCLGRAAAILQRLDQKRRKQEDRI